MYYLISCRTSRMNTVWWTGDKWSREMSEAMVCDSKQGAEAMIERHEGELWAQAVPYLYVSEYTPQRNLTVTEREVGK